MPTRSATASSAQASATINTPGPLTNIYLSDELNCQVDHLGDASHEFFGDVPGACATLIATGGTLYGPTILPAGGAAMPRTPYTVVSQTAVTGAGTPASPYTVVSVVDAGASGLRLTQTDSYIVGAESYRTDVAVANTTGAPINFILYRAGDCFLQDSDQRLRRSRSRHRLGVVPWQRRRDHAEHAHRTVGAAHRWQLGVRGRVQRGLGRDRLPDELQRHLPAAATTSTTAPASAGCRRSRRTPRRRSPRTRSSPPPVRSRPSSPRPPRSTRWPPVARTRTTVTVTNPLGSPVCPQHDHRPSARGIRLHPGHDRGRDHRRSHDQRTGPHLDRAVRSACRRHVAVRVRGHRPGDRRHLHELGRRHRGGWRHRRPQHRPGDGRRARRGLHRLARSRSSSKRTTTATRLRPGRCRERGRVGVARWAGEGNKLDGIVVNFGEPVPSDEVNACRSTPTS